MGKPHIRKVTHFSKQLQRFREQMNLTQRETARRAHMTMYRYQCLERGDELPTDKERRQLAYVFNVSLDFFFSYFYLRS